MDDWSSGTFRFSIPAEDMKVETTPNKLDMALITGEDDGAEGDSMQTEEHL